MANNMLHNLAPAYLSRFVLDSSPFILSVPATKKYTSFPEGAHLPLRASLESADLTSQSSRMQAAAFSGSLP